MDAQTLSTILAWAMVALSAIICASVLRGRSDIDWSASATFALAALLLSVAAAVSATGVLSGGPALSEEARWIIIISRAVATVLFLGVAMDVTGRPRWIARLLRHDKR